MDDAVEGSRVELRDKRLVDEDLDLVLARGGDGRDELVEPAADLERLGTISIDSASSLERSSSCSTAAHALRLLLERQADLLALPWVEAVAEVVQRVHEAVDRRHRRPQLVGGKGDEVRHHLVRPLEREP